MASWIVHLRIADELLRMLPEVSEREFIFGNIAPDSGVPNESNTSYDPPKVVSHFLVKENGHNIAGFRKYAEMYLSGERAASYSTDEYSFHLGYYSHLMTDYLWVHDIHAPLVERDRENYEADKSETVRKWKRDWYDLDFRYLRDHPNFHAYNVLVNTVGFENRYLDFFTRDAFELSRQRIIDFYSERRTGLDREYPWLTPERADRFVSEAADAIYNDIISIYKKAVL